MAEPRARRGELPGRQRRDERGTHRVVEHRHQPPALDVAHRVGELPASLEADTDRARLGIDAIASPRVHHRFADGSRRGGQGAVVLIWLLVSALLLAASAVACETTARHGD